MSHRQRQHPSFRSVTTSTGGGDDINHPGSSGGTRTRYSCCVATPQRQRVLATKRCDVNHPAARRSARRASEAPLLCNERAGANHPLTPSPQHQSCTVKSAAISLWTCTQSKSATVKERRAKRVTQHQAFESECWLSQYVRHTMGYHVVSVHTSSSACAQVRAFASNARRHEWGSSVDSLAL